MASDEYRRRTAITRLEISQRDEQCLGDTVDEWRRGCQIAVDEAWGEATTRSGVQQLAYDAIRDGTDLGSQHAVLATRHAADCLKACEGRPSDQVSKPEFTAPTVTYDARTMTLFDDGSVSLTTTGSRVHAELVLPDDDDGYQFQYLDADRWRLTESTLHRRGGDWYLHLGFRTSGMTDGTTTGNGTVLGVDLGVEQVAVTSTARFFSGSELNHRRREFERVRGALQERGTRSAHRTLQSLGGREDEYVKHVLHEVANGIVEEAIEYGCDGIVFENLDGIKRRVPDADWHAEWAFDRLLQYVEYKATAAGIFVTTVDPRNTSKRCAVCGWTSDENRPERDTFACTECGNRNHADYNAAKNVASAYLRRGPQSSRRKGVSQYALKSGTMTADGEFTPHSGASDVESTDKPGSP